MAGAGGAGGAGGSGGGQLFAPGETIASIAGGETSEPQGLAVDDQGNVYVTGTYYGPPFTLGFLSLDRPLGIETFVAKLTPSLDPVWLRGAYGSDNQIPSDIASDGDVVVVVGQSSSQVTVPGLGALPGYGPGHPYQNNFVIVYDDAGTPLWGRVFPMMIWGVDFVEGDIVIAGHFIWTIDIDGFVLTSAGAADVVAARLSRTTGNAVWAKRFGGAQSDGVGTLRTSSSGGIFLPLYSQDGQLDLGGGPLGAGGLGHLDASGAHVWTRGFQQFPTPYAARTAPVGGGGAFLAGQSSVPVDFGAGPVGGANQFWVVRTDALGAVTFGNAYGAPATFTQPITVAANEGEDAFVVAGQLLADGSADLGAGPFVATSGGPFVASYDGSGNLVGHRLFDGYGASAAAVEIAVRPDGGVIATGFFQDQIDLGQGNLLSPTFSVWIARFAPW